MYRQFKAFNVGGRIIPLGINISSHWVAKWGKNFTPTEAMLNESLVYVNTNPFKDQILDIFRLAKIDYGRMDFSVLNDQIQVWEINTNPNWPGIRLVNKDSLAYPVYVKKFITALTELSKKGLVNYNS